MCKPRDFSNSWIVFPAFPINAGIESLETKTLILPGVRNSIFGCGSNLYNLDFTRKLSNNMNDIFLVEGYMDVVGLSKNKVDNVVANLGTSLTTRQILTLNQFFQHIIVCFDGD